MSSSRSRQSPPCLPRMLSHLQLGQRCFDALHFLLNMHLQIVLTTSTISACQLLAARSGFVINASTRSHTACCKLYVSLCRPRPGCQSIDTRWKGRSEKKRRDSWSLYRGVIWCARRLQNMRLCRCSVLQRSTATCTHTLGVCNT